MPQGHRGDRLMSYGVVLGGDDLDWGHWVETANAQRQRSQCEGLLEEQRRARPGAQWDPARLWSGRCAGRETYWMTCSCPGSWMLSFFFLLSVLDLSSIPTTHHPQIVVPRGSGIRLSGFKSFLYCLLCDLGKVP